MRGALQCSFLSLHVVCYRQSLHHVTPKWVMLQWDPSVHKCRAPRLSASSITQYVITSWPYTALLAMWNYQVRKSAMGSTLTLKGTRGLFWDPRGMKSSFLVHLVSKYAQLQSTKYNPPPPKKKKKSQESFCVIFSMGALQLHLLMTRVCKG